MQLTEATTLDRKSGEADGSAVHSTPQASAEGGGLGFLRRLGRNERGLSAFFYGGWYGHGFEAVDVEVFVKIETEEIGCGPEDEGAVQKVAQALDYFVAY
jgi:hypothetical protein